MIVDRIKYIIDNEGFSVRKFEAKIGIAQGNISRAIKDKMDVRSSLLIRIMDCYPRYDANWLITGNGEMLKSEVVENKIDAEPKEEYGNASIMFELIQHNRELSTDVRNMHKEVGGLREEIGRLKNCCQPKQAEHGVTQK